MNVTALLLIDLQRDFLESQGRLHVPADDAERVIAVANRMIDHAKRSGWEIIWIRNEFRRTQWIGNFFRNYAAVAGAPGADIDPRIHFAGAPTVVKWQADAFSNPELEPLLRQSAAGRLVMLGLMTEECVRATAWGAIRRGFEVEIVEDGIATMDEAAHQKGLAKMKALRARMRQSADILTEPVATQDTPAKKQ